MAKCKELKGSAVKGITSPEVDEAEAKANSHEVAAKIALIFFSQILHFDPIFFPKKTKFSVDFRRNFKTFGSKRALAWGFISKHP